MRTRSIITALGALAIAAAPVAASAQSNVPASAQAEISPKSETVEGEQIRGGFLLPLAIIIAIILGVLLLTNDDEDPVSA